MEAAATRRLVCTAATLTGLVWAWTARLWLRPAGVGEATLGTAVTTVLALQLLGSLNRQADTLCGPGWLRRTLEHRIGPPAMQGLASVWLVGMFTRHRFTIMVLTTVAAMLILAATELVADPRWLTARGTFAVVVVAAGIAAAAMATLLLVAFVLAAGAVILLIGLGLARRLWR